MALGRVLLQKAPCLVLDEPTNHLDFQTVEALTIALQNYPGTVIVVSHDRSFIKRIGTKILEVKNGKVELFPGSYEEYVWRMQQYSLPAEKQSSFLERDSSNPDKALRIQERENKKKFEREWKQWEKKIQQIELEISEIQKENTELNEKIQIAMDINLVKKLGENSIKLNSLEADWLEALAAKEALEKNV